MKHVADINPEGISQQNCTQQINIAIIGMGQRGRATFERLKDIPAANVVATCDKDVDWHVLTAMPEVDLVYVCTPWELHVEIATEAMKQGKHVALEVPAAMTVQQCELLVRISRWTSRHCMMLENCCYDTWHLGIKEMVGQGMFGRITHLEGAYIHPVDGEWMLNQRRQHKGNPYPTHGLGPMCQLLDADDHLDYLVSMSNGNAESIHLNDTLISTHKGVTMLLQYDTTTPRPYNRLQTVSGTKGFAQKYPVPTIQFEDGTLKTGTDAECYVESFIAPELQQILQQGKSIGVRNLMNYLMDRRLIDALCHEKMLNLSLPDDAPRTLVELDMEVHEAALWSSITELTELSSRHGCARIDIPDF